ncbi:MAG: argininosuccinate lyase [Clostridia bacterium]|nr:argininosuccinate lyase [Clostridia bacterium]
MWAGRSAGVTDQVADDFNTSLPYDQRMYRQDIAGSIAHATMLGAKGILPQSDVDTIIDGLSGILMDLDSGKLDFSAGGEDIHMFIESELTARIGDLGKKLHTARSRNDQVALDLRLYLRDEVKTISQLIRDVIDALLMQAETYADAIMPGYTHLQRAQPITFGHHLMAYVQMLFRDLDRLSDAAKRMNVSPLGSCALAGTTYPTDRQVVADLLEMNGICENSLDGVSDRDYCIELQAAFATIMMHLSRLSEEIILWTSWEFRFVELSDAYSTGSSIMPQKKNSDMAELVRGKTGRVYGNLMGTLTMLKGLPLAYNKDMQEDKEAIFDSVDTLKISLAVFAPMVATMRPLPENMRAAAAKGFINATDCADYLTKKGMPFRTAYKITGALVADCIRDGLTLETLPLEQYKAASELFEADIYDEISMETCVMRRTSAGGTSVESVRAQIASAKASLANKD